MIILIYMTLLTDRNHHVFEDCAGENAKDSDGDDDSPILDDSIESIAGEAPQSSVRCVVMASLKSRSCTVGHLRREGC